MSYLLPTITSLNRQNAVPVRRSRTTRHEIDTVCTHREVRRFAGGRCPLCYRNSMRRYGRRVLERSRRPRRPAQAVPAVPVLPHLVPPRVPSYNSMPLSSFMGRLSIPLPGQKIYGCGSDSCSICMNTYEQDRQCQKLPCGHKFHVWCYQKWYIKKHNCPLCRMEFT